MNPVQALGLVLVGGVILAAYTATLRNGSAAQGIITSLGTAYANAITAAKA